MKTPDHSSKPLPRRALNRLTRRLSFFVARNKHLLDEKAALMVELAAEQYKPPDREGLEGDQDCACE